MFWEDIAVTAGHCIYDADHGGLVTSVEVIPAANQGLTPHGTTTAINVYTSTEWSQNSNREYDYGVIELADAIGNSTGWFGIYWTIFSLANTNVTITGYPGKKDEHGNSLIVMYKMNGTIARSTTRKLFYTIDTSKGQSGSPIYNADHTVIGIHTQGVYQGQNSGVRITLGIFNYLESFRE